MAAGALFVVVNGQLVKIPTCGITGAPAGTVTWGGITGTLSNQLDLQTALDLKVTGAASATDNAIARYDGITGKLIQDSSTFISDTGLLTVRLNGGVAGTDEVQISHTGSLGLIESKDGPMQVTAGGDSFFFDTNIFRPGADLGASLGASTIAWNTLHIQTIEIRGANPLIDFKSDSGEDADCRIIKTSDGLVLSTGGQGSRATALTLDSSQNAIFEGTLGLGVTASTYNLHIRKTGDASIFLEADTDNATETDNPFLKMSQDGGGVQAILGICGGNGIDPEQVAFSGALSNATLLGSTDGFPLQLGTNSIVALTIDTSQNSTFAGAVAGSNLSGTNTGDFDPLPYVATGTGANIPAAETQMNIGAEVESNSNYALSTNSITVTLAGFYDVDYYINITEDDLTGGVRGVTSAFLKDDTAIIEQSRSQTYVREASGGSGTGCSFGVRLGAGSVLDLFTDQTGTGTPNLSQGSTQITIKRVSD